MNIAELHDPIRNSGQNSGGYGIDVQDIKRLQC